MGILKGTVVGRNPARASSIDRVLAVVAKLLRQTVVPPWALSDEPLVSAILYKQPVKRGPKGERLRRLFRILDPAGLSWLLILMVSTPIGIALWFRAHGGNKGLFEDRRIFVGFGAGSEEALWSKYKLESGPAAVRIDQVTLSGYSDFIRPGLIRMIFLVWQAAIGLPVSLRASLEAIKSKRIDVLTVIGMRLGHYAFQRAFWEAQATTHISEVAFASPDTAAFACIDAGHTTRFLQHGLLSRSLLIPDFHRIEALTTDESDYLSRLLPQSQISTRAVSAITASKLKNTILVAARHGHDPVDIQVARDFVEWAREKGFQVIVRLHPSGPPNFWPERFPDLDINDGKEPIGFALRRYRPKFVVSWFSTILAESLLHRIVPITLASQVSPLMRDLVYPLFRRTLHWPDDKEKLDELIKGQLDYGTVIETLAGDSELSKPKVSFKKMTRRAPRV